MEACFFHWDRNGQHLDDEYFMCKLLMDNGWINYKIPWINH